MKENRDKVWRQAIDMEQLAQSPEHVSSTCRQQLAMLEGLKRRGWDFPGGAVWDDNTDLWPANIKGYRRTFMKGS
jgi:hypothetical protein